MITKEQFSVLMAGLGEVFNKPLSEAALAIYYEILKGYSFEDVHKACSGVVRTHRYATFPAPFEILDYLETSADDKGLKAWLTVREAIRKHGYYASVDFGDQAIHRAIIELGGWQVLCSKTSGELDWIEKDFIRLYNNLLKNPRSAPDHLVGYFEADNREKSFPGNIPPIVKIGLADRPLEITKGD